MIKIKHIFILTLIIHFFNAIQSKIFQKCSDRPFCIRNLNLEKSSDSFHVDKESISIKRSTISMKLNSQSDKEYSKDIYLKIYILKNGFFRVKLKDIENKRFHFDKNDDKFMFNMEAMNKTQNFKLILSDDKLSIYYFEKITKVPYMTKSEIKNDTQSMRYEVIISYQPFSIKYILGQNTILEINSKNQLMMEFPPEDFIKQEEEALSSVKLDIKFNDAQYIWGLPERSGDVEIIDTVAEQDAYRLYNVDSFLFEKDQYFGIYGNIPFLLTSHKQDEIYSGFIWNNPSETYLRVKTQGDDKSTLWISESGIIDFSFWADSESLNSFYYKFHKYVGPAELPLASALGYHQCRWNYENTNDLRQVDLMFDEYDIPYDYIWLDIEHTDEKKYMTWNSNFKDVDKFLMELAEKSRNLVVIIDPHIKKDSGYSIYKEAYNNEFYINGIQVQNYLNQYPFEGYCWCQEAIYLNFYDEAVRSYWKNQIISSEFFLNAKNIYIWNDMNEPSVFNQLDMTLPKKTYFKYNEVYYEHRDGHNLYGYLMHKSSFEALKTKYKKRPFVLTRSFYLGSHKYGAVWTGDTRSSFTDLGQTIPMILSMSISGFSFVGGDVGGFHGEADHYLLYRWYQLGTFYPFFRAHSHNEVSRREPWLYDEETLSIIRESVIIRYKLLPYIYLTFFQHFKTGMPVTRPLWFYYKDKLSNDYSNKQFFFGDALLIRPVLKESEHFQNSIKTYLPEENRWYNFYNYEEYTQKGEINVKINNFKIGVFIKGGSIIPMKWTVRRSSKLMKNDPYTLIVALDSNQFASGMIYFDDEESYDYQERNIFTLKRVIFNKNKLSIENLNENFNLQTSIERIIILGLHKTIEDASYMISSSKQRHKLEYEIKNNNVLELKRLKIPVNTLWKIKLKFHDYTSHN